ncbi:DUF2752 domain-containing protein [bacterium]|nr:MAG: DUF2752 domain-containing protein [bacterium]
MLISQNNPRNRWSQLVWFGIWGAVTAFGIFLKADPHGHGTHQSLGLPPCPSVLLLGRPCPGCGLTTSWTALLHGDFGTAFRAHPLGPLLYLGYTVSALLSLYLARKSLRFDPADRRIERAMMIGAAAFFAFGAVRMALTTGYRTEKEMAMARIFGAK